MREHGVTDAAGEAGTSEGNHLVAFNVMFNQDSGPEGLTKLMWRRLELSYTFLSRGEGHARL